MAEICERFGDRYANLRPRVCKTFGEALNDAKKPLATRYGAVVGLTALGALAARSLIMPVAAEWTRTLEAQIAESPNDSADARRCIAALMDAALLYFKAELAITRPSPLTPLALGASSRTKSKRHLVEPTKKKRRRGKAHFIQVTRLAGEEETTQQPSKVRRPRGPATRLALDLLDVFGETLVPFTAGAPPDVFI